MASTSPPSLPVPASQRRPPTVAIDPVALVVTECITVTSAMRKHARWAHSSVSAILGGGALKQSGPGTGTSTPTGGGGLGKLPATAGYLGVPDGDGALASRWGLRGKKGKSLLDNPLMAAFAKLRSDLKSYRDIHTFDTPALLHPFLQVIRSSSTSAPITSLALIAITKFLAYRIISAESKRLPEGMQLLSSAITHCRFEASDSAADEVVLLRVLNLMESMFDGPGGEALSDESVCEMMETGLSMCCQIRLSEVLKRSAEISMVKMCQTIFQRLKVLEEEAGGAEALELQMRGEMEALRLDPAVNNDTSTGLQSSNTLKTQPQLVAEEETSSRRTSTQLNGSQIELAHYPDTDSGEEIKPYSLPSIRELFRVLVDLLDPNDKQHTDTMRVMALRIVDVALEVAGPSIAGSPSLAILAKDTLCRHLFQLARSENMAVLNEALRVAGTLLSTCRSVLKLQQELYLSYLVACLHPRVDIPQEPGIDPALYEGVPQAPTLARAGTPVPNANEGRATPVPVRDRQKLGLEGGARKPDAREAMVENVGHLVRIPSFMVELYVNYDCDIDRNDLCVDMVGLLSRNAFPDSATWSTTNVPPLCLDALLSHVQFVADRLDDEPQVEGYPDRDKLRQQRDLKKIIVRGASKFNENPKAGIAFLASQKVIDNPDNPHSIVKFLHATTRIDKKVLGEWISKRQNEHILEAFMEMFDFTGQRVDEALRQLLNTFRLPGESQLIERIITKFSEKCCANGNPEGVADKDAVYVLTYAIIMLNTDQHNPNLRSTKRMAPEDFARNLRGVNGGKDFEPEYLQSIFDSIKTREIILPEEHDNKHAYDHAWNELLVKAHSVSDLKLSNTNIFDGDMFAATWRPIVATLSYVFVSASEDAVFQRVVTGFDQCAQIAGKYGLSGALDQIVFCLSNLSTLSVDKPPNTALNTEVQAGEKADKKIMVSETAVRFGRDFKAQLATVVLFRVVTGNETALRDGWVHLVRILLNLLVNSLMPASTNTDRLDIPAIPLKTPAQIIERSQRQSEAGYFSAFTSYVSSFANDEPPEPSDQEVEYTLCTVDCINTCAVDELVSNVHKMPLESLQALVAALVSQIPESSSPRVITVKQDLPAPSPIRPNGSMKAKARPMYDPTLVYVLELATAIAVRDEETVEHLGKTVADALMAIVRDTNGVHPIVIARAAYYLLTLLKASTDHDFLRVTVVLHSLSSFDEDLMKQAALPVVKGMRECIQSSSSGLRNEMSTSPDFWALLKAVQAAPEAAAIAFDIVIDLVAGPAPSITADNYESVILVLNDFATAGHIGSVQEQKQDEVAAARQRGHKQEGSQGQAKGKSKPAVVDAVVRGSKATNMLYEMTHRVPGFIAQSQLEVNEAWSTYWRPIFISLSRQSLNPCRQIRHQALSSLQRALLSPSLTSAAPNGGAMPLKAPTPSNDSKQWALIFDQVLFPLIKELLRPEVFSSDPIGMVETRVQAATLLCKIFLHYLVLLSEWEGMVELWGRILAVLDRLLNSGQADALEEAVPESLKNILLVMSDGGYLVPPPVPGKDAKDSKDTSTLPVPGSEYSKQQARLWDETSTKLARFLPQLMTDVFGEEAAKRSAGVIVPPSPRQKKAVPVLEGKKSKADNKDGKGKGKEGKETPKEGGKKVEKE